jgi:hypothetical protein
LYYIDPATQKNGENLSNKELTIGKLPSKMLDGKMLRGEYWPENDQQ